MLKIWWKRLSTTRRVNAIIMVLAALVALVSTAYSARVLANGGEVPKIAIDATFVVMFGAMFDSLAKSWEGDQAYKEFYFKCLPVYDMYFWREFNRLASSHHDDLFQLTTDAHCYAERQVRHQFGDEAYDAKVDWLKVISALWRHGNSNTACYQNNLEWEIDKFLEEVLEDSRV